MKLIIELKNIRKDRARIAVRNMVNLYKKKFRRILKKAAEKENSSLDYHFSDETADGFRVIITGEEPDVQNEYDLIRDEYIEIDNKKIGRTGKATLLAIGLSFLYWLEK